jgi:hypothetical protein
MMHVDDAPLPLEPEETPVELPFPQNSGPGPRAADASDLTYDHHRDALDAMQASGAKKHAAAAAEISAGFLTSLPPIPRTTVDTDGKSHPLSTTPPESAAAAPPPVTDEGGR